jgi:hypothetical protein
MEGAENDMSLKQNKKRYCYVLLAGGLVGEGSAIEFSLVSFFVTPDSKQLHDLVIPLFPKLLNLNVFSSREDTIGEQHREDLVHGISANLSSFFFLSWFEKQTTIKHTANQCIQCAKTSWSSAIHKFRPNPDCFLL